MPAFATTWRDSNSKNLMRRGTLAAGGCTRLSAVLRPLIVALLVPRRSLPAAASAAVVDDRAQPAGGVDYGETHAVTGKLTGAFGAPLVGRQVVLEVRTATPTGSRSRRSRRR